MINTLLFDLDGTLVDSNELIIASFHKALSECFPDRSFSRPEIIPMIGPPLQESFGALNPEKQSVTAMIEIYLKTYRQLEFSYIDIYPHAIEMLDGFKARGFNLAVVTTKFRRSAMPSIRHFGIDRRISTIISLDDVSNHKPHPEPVLKALAAFPNVDQALMVGDAPSDILAGKNAGVLTCGVSWTLKPLELKRANPDFWIDDFRDLTRIIDKYNQEA